MFSIDTRSRVPIYEQLEENIISLVASGALAADEQLPSVRSLARELGVNPNTVQKAYQELESKGIIYQAMGRGSFISPQSEGVNSLLAQKLAAAQAAIAEARRMGAQRSQILELVQQAYGGQQND